MAQAPSARDLAADLLLDAERRGTWIHRALPAARDRLGDPREKALLTELAYGVLRHRGTLDAVLAPASRRRLDRLTPPVRVGLRLALFQVLFLDRIPAHAAVDRAVFWVRGRGGARAAGYANAVLRAVVRQVEGPARGAEDLRRDVPREDGSAVRLAACVFPDPDTDPPGNLAARYAMPRWLVERWLDARGPDLARAVLRVAISRPPLALRARRDRDALVAALQEEGLSVRRGVVPGAVLVDGSGETKALDAVRRGEAWVQDMTAQRVAPLLDPRPGQRLLDLCAAPGGKTLHLADLLEGRGEVVAADVDDAKVRRLEALGRHVPEGVGLDVMKVEREGALPWAPASFDGVLVDAPCSNTGVLRRRVEARWRLDPGDFGRLAALQRALLERALPLVRSGGRLVYATCSLEPEENADLVRAFLADHPQVEEAARLEVPPGRDADGGFTVALRVRG